MPLIKKLQAIGDEIRAQVGSTDKYTLEQMALEIKGFKHSDLQFIQLEYIESNGSQYIDTGFMPNQDTRVDITFQTEDTESATIIAADENLAEKAFGIFSNVVEYGSSTTSATFYGYDPITVSLNRHILSMDDEIIATLEYSAFETPCNLTIFAANRNGEIIEPSTMKLYGCKIYDNDVLVRNFIPAINADGEVGLIDLVNDEFYVNRGTGAFSGDTIDKVQTYLLVDAAGNEVPAVLVNEEVLLTATANDIRIDTVAVTDEGVTTGEKIIPSYETNQGIQLIMANKAMSITNMIGSDVYDYTKFQAIICPLIGSVSKSVSAEITSIDDSVYEVRSTTALSTIYKNHENKSIDLGITNDFGKPCLIRYFTYKEVE